jgi:hypothetical protein
MLSAGLPGIKITMCAVLAAGSRLDVGLFDAFWNYRYLFLLPAAQRDGM